MPECPSQPQTDLDIQTDAETKPEFRLDFVGGWNKARYVAAQENLEAFTRHYPLRLPKDSAEEVQSEADKLRSALTNIGLSDDLAKLRSIGVRKRRMLAVVGPTEVEKLGLSGTPAQYKSVYEPALEECEFDSPHCEQREICMEELYDRLSGLKQHQDMMDERKCKKPKLEVWTEREC